ncbi:MAG: sulfotransferase [Alphaproteobacteria bacterium]|nr:sulfotransferase [Alphaproteobacteria bacterium]
MQDKLIFLIGPPRSGSTLLMRMLSTHSQIFSRPEPHLLTPLAHLGVYDNVDHAPFDQLQAAQATREFIADLPGGEADYLDALRAYCEVLYGRMLSTQDKPYFLDKTPANALILPFLAKVFPEARYIVLTRNPCSVWDSYAESFFDGDTQAAYDFNPVLERYVPAMAAFLREKPVDLVHVRYEDVVTEPEEQLKRIYAHIGVPHEPDTVNYGAKQPAVTGGLGDPIGVSQHKKPVTSSLEKWARNTVADPARLDLLQRIIANLDPADVRTWGYDPDTLFEPIDRVDAAEARAKLEAKRRKDRFDRYKMQRRVLVLLRRNMDGTALGRLVLKTRFLCDVLLRGAGRGFSIYRDHRYGQPRGASEAPLGQATGLEGADLDG